MMSTPDPVPNDLTILAAAVFALEVVLEVLDVLVLVVDAVELVEELVDETAVVAMVIYWMTAS